MTELESDNGRPLTPEENSELRDLLAKDKRIAWFWSSLRVFVTWITVIVTAYYAAKTFIQDMIQHGAGK